MTRFLLLAIVVVCFCVFVHGRTTNSKKRSGKRKHLKKETLPDIPSSYYESNDASASGNEFSLTELFHSFGVDSPYEVEENSHENARFAQTKRRAKHKVKHKRQQQQHQQKTRMQSGGNPAYSLESPAQFQQQFPGVFSEQPFPSSSSVPQSQPLPQNQFYPEGTNGDQFRFQQQQQQQQVSNTPHQGSEFTGPNTPIGFGRSLTMFPPVGPPPPAANQLPAATAYRLMPNNNAYPLYNTPNIP